MNDAAKDNRNTGGQLRPFGNAVRGGAELDLKVQRRVKRRSQEAVEVELAKGYASLEASNGYTYPSLDALYTDVLPKGQRRVDGNETYPLFRTKMHHVYVLSLEARADLRAVRLAVARRAGTVKAEEVVRAIIRDIGWLADLPNTGTPRADLLGFPYAFPVQHAIYYHPTREPSGSKVVRILDSDRYVNVAPGQADYWAAKKSSACP